MKVAQAIQPSCRVTCVKPIIFSMGCPHWLLKLALGFTPKFHFFICWLGITERSCDLFNTNCQTTGRGVGRSMSRRQKGRARARTRRTRVVWRWKRALADCRKVADYWSDTLIIIIVRLYFSERVRIIYETHTIIILTHRATCSSAVEPSVDYKIGLLFLQEEKDHQTQERHNYRLVCSIHIQHTRTCIPATYIYMFVNIYIHTYVCTRIGTYIHTYVHKQWH